MQTCGCTPPDSAGLKAERNKSRDPVPKTRHLSKFPDHLFDKKHLFLKLLAAEIYIDGKSCHNTRHPSKSDSRFSETEGVQKTKSGCFLQQVWLVVIVEYGGVGETSRHTDSSSVAGVSSCVMFVIHDQHSDVRSHVSRMCESCGCKLGTQIESFEDP